MNIQHDWTHFYIIVNYLSSDYQYLQVKADDFIISTTFLSFMPHIIKYFFGTRRYNLTNLTSMYSCIPLTNERKEKQTTIHCLSTSYYMDIITLVIQYCSMHIWARLKTYIIGGKSLVTVSVHNRHFFYRCYAEDAGHKSWRGGYRTEQNKTIFYFLFLFYCTGYQCFNQ